MTTKVQAERTPTIDRISKDIERANSHTVEETQALFMKAQQKFPREICDRELLLIFNYMSKRCLEVRGEQQKERAETEAQRIQRTILSYWADFFSTVFRKFSNNGSPHHVKGLHKEITEIGHEELLLWFDYVNRYGKRKEDRISERTDARLIQRTILSYWADITSPVFHMFADSSSSLYLPGLCADIYNGWRSQDLVVHIATTELLPTFEENTRGNAKTDLEKIVHVWNRVMGTLRGFHDDPEKDPHRQVHWKRLTEELTGERIRFPSLRGTCEVIEDSEMTESFTRLANPSTTCFGEHTPAPDSLLPKITLEVRNIVNKTQNLPFTKRAAELRAWALENRRFLFDHATHDSSHFSLCKHTTNKRRLIFSAPYGTEACWRKQELPDCITFAYTDGPHIYSPFPRARWERDTPFVFERRRLPEVLERRSIITQWGDVKYEYVWVEKYEWVVVKQPSPSQTTLVAARPQDSKEGKRSS